MTEAKTQISPTTIAAGATFATDAMRPFSAFWAHQFDKAFSIDWADYGQLLPSMLDPTSPMRASSGPKLIFVRANDAVVSDDTFSRALTSLAASHPVFVVICPQDAASDDELIGSMSAISGVTVISGRDACRDYGVSQWEDAVSGATADLPYTDDAFAALLTAAIRRAITEIERPVKLIAVDADNTLWRGVIGEDGVDGIQFDAAHLCLHRRLSAAAASGKIVCLVTKNNADDVELAWTSQLEDTLPRSSVLTIKAGWGPKSQAFAELLDLYEVAPDSAVFIDDNPVECAEIRSAFPSARVIPWPTDPSNQVFADHLWSLDGNARTAADQTRLETYRQAAARKSEEALSVDLKAFHDGLNLLVDIAEVNAASEDRVLQLSSRTTQFNAAPKTLVREDVRNTAASSYAVQVRDRFGDYGIVGVVRVCEDNGTLNVLDFLLSCRALGRGVEHEMVRFLGGQAASLGIETIRFCVEATDRNAPIRTFIGSIAKVDQTNKSAIITAAAARSCEFNPITASSAETKTETQPTSTYVGVDRGERDERIARLFTSAVAIVDAARAGPRERPEDLGPMVTAASADEIAVVAVWENVLQVSPVGVTDPLPMLGAKSLHLVRAHGALQQRLGREFDVTLLFRANSVRDFLTLLGGEARATEPGRSGKIRNAASSMAARRQRARGRIT